MHANVTISLLPFMPMPIKVSLVVKEKKEDSRFYQDFLNKCFTVYIYTWFGW